MGEMLNSELDFVERFLLRHQKKVKFLLKWVDRFFKALFVFALGFIIFYSLYIVYVNFFFNGF